MAPKKTTQLEESEYREPGEYIGTIGNMKCYVTKLRGTGLTDVDSNWRLWNADMKVYRDGAGRGEDEETWASIDEEILTKMERRRKAILWFSISEGLREKHLLDMGGRDKTSEDVYKRVYERVAPADSVYEPLEVLYVTESMREDVRKRRALKKAKEEVED